MRSRTLVLVALGLLVVQVGCVRPEGTAMPSAVPATPVVGQGECDARATRIEPNALSRREMRSTSSPYPANCLYYCLWVPEGGETLDIAISDLAADLDLFVGFGEFSSVVGVEPTQSVSYTWKSNGYGTQDEAVRIPAPQTGMYYIEVCSYEGEATPFNLSTRLR